MQDTIYAPSSAVGGAIAVLRVSGAEAGKAVRILNRDVRKTPRVLRHVLVLDGETTVDDGMAVYFPAPATYTGEDMLEINCHGGAVTVQRILSLLAGCGFRPAEGGEFTRRAFMNGKLDLSQAEAVMDVITAEAEQSLRSAVRQLGGSVSREVEAVSELLLDALSGIDAAIDYPDEAEADAYAALPEALSEARARLEHLIWDGRRGRVLRDGVHAVILGRPNVGKSSLLNALLGEERAIVTAHAGTTRDVLDERVSFDGVPVRLIDTAGIRDASDEAERIGVQRARTAMERADVLLVLLDGSLPLTHEDRALLAETEGRTRIVLQNKSDLPQAFACPGALPISARTGEGLETLRREVLRLTAPLSPDAACITNERHLEALERALAAIAEADPASELDCIATDIRAALHAVGEITGEDVDAAVLDRIFSRFCVGK